mmetsp:Transcript_7163/g.29771  ORF Transcript_7163/g.29771 Transcript_7163/m.29771 type:complete len:193 (-) Transcript_7163:1140-1718(-)
MAAAAPLDIDSENKAVLVVLNQADEFYREQQRLAKVLRKGFLDLAKARSSVGPSCRISALDCREDIQAQYAVDADAIDGVSMGSLDACDAWRTHHGGVAGGAGSGAEASLRRRGADDDEEGGSMMMTEDADKPKDTDTVLLFTALAPPALRKAKREFVAALAHAVKLANMIERIRVAEAKLAPAIAQERFAV